MKTMRYDATLGILETKSPHEHIHVGPNTLEKCQAALKKLFVPEYNSGGVRAFSGLRQAYILMTGDSDITGTFRPANISPDLRSCQDFNSATFSYALQDAMNVYLSKAYKEFPYHEEILISEKKNVKDFKLIKSVQIGYFGELASVDPETGDYQETPPLTDTEAQYRIGQKGGITWVTRRLFINDSIEIIKSIVKRMARSARLAHAKYVWNFFISNALCPDGTAWFTVEHGNLGANALDIPDMIVAITALANMTEPGLSSEKIGLDLQSFDWHLVVPIDNWDLATRKNQQDSYYTDADLTTKVSNACHKLFGEKNERIITCPFMTAANDWGLIRNREDVPIVEMSYLNGQEVPEIIQEVGPKPLSNMLFVSDRLGYKLRHEYGGVLADYRSGYKAVVE